LLDLFPYFDSYVSFIQDITCSQMRCFESGHIEGDISHASCCQPSHVVQELSLWPKKLARN